MISKNCKHCNREFKTNHKLKEYCDLTCQMKAKAERDYARKKARTELKKLKKC